MGAPLLLAEGAAAVAAGAVISGARIGVGAASVGASEFSSVSSALNLRPTVKAGPLSDRMI